MNIKAQNEISKGWFVGAIAAVLIAASGSQGQVTLGTENGEWPRLTMVRRLQGGMLYNDPVVYDWQHISTKALVIGGEEDGLVPDFPPLAQNVADELQNSAILLYPGIGHAPQIEIPDQFHNDLVRFLKSDPDEPASDWK